LNKEINQDKQRVGKKSGDEFALEKSVCAEYQARYYKDDKKYGNLAVHGIPGSIICTIKYPVPFSWADNN
jgi:hypothetical protein